MGNAERYVCFILGALFAGSMVGLVLAVNVHRPFEALVCVCLAALFVLAVWIIDERAEPPSGQIVDNAREPPRGG